VSEINSSCCGRRRPPKIKSSLLAERMCGSSGTAQRDTVCDSHLQNDVGRPQSSDAVDQQLIGCPKSGSGDASVVSRSVASACSIESAIDSVILQSRATEDHGADLPDSLPPELMESVDAIKDIVCYRLNS